MIDILNLDFDSIKKIYKENFNELQITFNKGQGVFLNDIYKRYGNDLDCAVIILHYAKNLHRQILRKREADLNYDISRMINNIEVISIMVYQYMTTDILGKPLSE